MNLKKITGKAAAGGTKYVQVMLSLKHLSNFWRSLKMPLINFEINLILTWPEKCELCKDPKATIFAIAVTKLYLQVATLLIIQNYYSNQNQVLNEQLIGTNLNQK